eukprot:7391725-Prymnesium_polylepis.3
MPEQAEVVRGDRTAAERDCARIQPLGRTQRADRVLGRRGLQNSHASTLLWSDVFPPNIIPRDRATRSNRAYGRGCVRIHVCSFRLMQCNKYMYTAYSTSRGRWTLVQDCGRTRANLRV